MGIRDGIKDAWEDVLSPLFDEFASDVTVEILDRDMTAKDDLYDEPVEEKKYLPAVSLKARVKLEKERLILPGGEAIDVDGRTTFKIEDLKVNGIDMHFPTRITFKGKSFSIAHVKETSSIGEEFLLTMVFLKGI